MRFLALLLIIIVFPCQSAMDITRELVAPEHAVPGQPMTVAVTFWTDTWFTPPPVWPDFGIQGGMMLNTSLPDQLLTRQKSGISWSGIRMERQVVSWDQGSLSFPAVDITLTSSGQPPVTVHLSELKKAVKWPPDIHQPDRFLPARELKLSQIFTFYHAGKDKILRAGDTVDRVVTLTGKDIFPPQIPQVLFAIPGDGSHHFATVDEYIRSSRGEPEIEIHQERIRYLLAKSGTLIIPPVHLRWWDTENQKWQLAELEGKTLKVSRQLSAGGENVLRGRFADNTGSFSAFLLIIIILLVSFVWFARKSLHLCIVWLNVRWQLFWLPVSLPCLGSIKQENL
ncbi:TPA: protein BatD [Raoultella planticola]|nr:protein BatD [Raoultella planticola]